MEFEECLVTHHNKSFSFVCCTRAPFQYYYRREVESGEWTEVFDMKQIKKRKTFSAFLSSYTRTSEKLGKREILWEQEPVLQVLLF